MPHTFEGGPAAESAIQRLLRLACSVFRVKAGVVSLFDEDAVVFRTTVGLEDYATPPNGRLARELASLPGGLTVIEDLSLDPRLADHPIVTGPTHARFYAGATLYDAERRPIGSIGILGDTPRGPLAPDETASLRRLALLASDIFALKREERASAARAETLEMAETMAGVGHFRIETATGQVTWSDEVFRIHGFAPGAVDATVESARGDYHPDDAREVRAMIDRAIQTGEGYDAPLRLRRPDGEERTTRTRGRIERDEAGRISALFGVIQDITDSVRTQNALVDAKLAAEAASEAKSDFLANVSHELRTPLTSIIGFSAFLKASPSLNDKDRHYADRIASASRALLAVINDVLDYSKIEAGALDIDPAPFAPRALAESAAALVADQCADKGLSLEVVVADDVPAGFTGDEGRMRQVALNFLSNAVKFTESGRIELGLSMAGDRLRIAVADTGVGIAPEAVERLFERFTQADASTTRRYGGTGLGLAISSRLVEMMHGRIGVESRPGEGSTFWFEVPERALSRP